MYLRYILILPVPDWFSLVFPFPPAVLGVINSKLLRSFKSRNAFIVADINPNGLNISHPQYNWGQMHTTNLTTPKWVEYLFGATINQYLLPNFS
jgi:hypothetical protein